MVTKCKNVRFPEPVTCLATNLAAAGGGQHAPRWGHNKLVLSRPVLTPVSIISGSFPVLNSPTGWGFEKEGRTQHGVAAKWCRARGALNFTGPGRLFRPLSLLGPFREARSQAMERSRLRNCERHGC